MFPLSPWATDIFPQLYFNMTAYPPAAYTTTKLRTTYPPRRSRKETLINPQYDDSSISSDDATDLDPWYTDHYEPLFPQRRHHSKPTAYTKKDFDAPYALTLRKISLAVPRHRAATAKVAQNEILILQHPLAHLRVEVAHEQLAEYSVFRVAVAGDVRLMEVLRDLVPGRHMGDASAWVKELGEWREVDLRMRARDVGEMGTVVKVKLCGERDVKRWME